MVLKLVICEMFFKNTSGNIKKAAFAGAFYPGTKNELQKELRLLFKKAKPVKTHLIPRALVVPHAGYVFSGKVAASVYNQIPENSNYKRVFVLASSHQFHFGGASVYNKGNYKTPLGEIEVDIKLANKLINSSDYFQPKLNVHENEHSLEVQLPFLQYKLGTKFMLVPIILGTNSAEECEKVATVLKPYFTPENLFVISSDFSHYPTYSDAKRVDRLTIQAICSNNPEQLLQTINENKKLEISNLTTSLCGWTSVLTLLYLNNKKTTTFIEIDYQNSGDAKTYGGKQSVVGYAGLAIYENNDVFFVSEDEKKELLEKARIAITKFVQTGKRSKPSPTISSGILNKKAGVFISIYINNELRGCIGGFAQEKSLKHMTQEMAVSAACDSRFDAVEKSELENMVVEISVLSPLKEINDIKIIELGKHGIFINQGLNSGTFLPQVAKKTGWNLKEFLGHCARDKAGIGWHGWKTAEISIFEAVIFKG